MQKPGVRKNPFESYTDSTSTGSFGSKLAKDAFNGLNDTFGTGLLDSMFGTPKTPEQKHSWEQEQKPSKPKIRIEKNIFNGNIYHESHRVPEQMKEMKTMIEQVKQEMQLVKKEASAFIDEVRDIDNIILNPGSEKASIYDIRFLQIVMSILRSMRKKINESRSWLGVARGRQNKRGSFMSRRKEKGTAYSLSHELNPSRSVQ